MRWFLLVSLLTGCFKPVTDADLAQATERAASWFSAVQRKDCETLLRISQTAMDLNACQQQADILYERFLSVSDVEGVRLSETESGVIEVDARVVDSESGERVLTLKLVRGRSGWVVRL